MGAGGAALKSVFDVFLHVAQVQRASAARLVPEQSDRTHVDSSVAQYLTSQSRKSEPLGEGERGYAYTLHSAYDTRKTCTRGVSICFVENIEFWIIH